MRTILLHPTHRKIVKLLCSHINAGNHIVIAQSDLCEFNQLMNRTNIAVERHKGIYRILLNVIRRSNADMDGNVGDDLKILLEIERAFAKAERKRLHITLRNIIVLPTIRKILRWLK